MLHVYNARCVVIIHHDTAASEVVTSQCGWGGAHRVSSSRVAYVYFEAVCVFHASISLFIAFVHGFLCLIG